jgi:formate dehydrogenase subunit gamma
VSRIIRHSFVDRILHWLMAFSVVILLATGFLPIIGIKFGWVTIHWISGLVLTAGVLVHIVRTLFWQDLASMWVGLRDIKDSVAALSQVLKREGEGAKPGKYSLAQKDLHHTVTLFVLVTIVTGLMMMVKVDTPFWERDPYWLSAETWGIVYVLHGIAALCLITIVMTHIYFAVRPEKLMYTRSMIRGWLTKEEYLQNHDPNRWKTE